MESKHLPDHHLTDEKYLFSEEEIQNISALVVTLKQIRNRLISEGVDIDNQKNHVATDPHFKK